MFPPVTIEELSAADDGFLDTNEEVLGASADVFDVTTAALAATVSLEVSAASNAWLNITWLHSTRPNTTTKPTHPKRAII